MTELFTTVFYWWFLVFTIGVISLPLTFKLFNTFADRGYGLSKVIGIILVSWLTWWLGSLKIAPFSFGPYVALALIWLANLFLLRKQKTQLFKAAKALWLIWLIEEGLFLITLAGFSFIRAHQPDIIGLEKYMDFGFVNSILKTKYFPPKDIWWQGGTINYYYFGHLMTAVLTYLSRLPSNITYNLMIASLFSLTFSAGFCLGGNLWHISLQKLKYLPARNRYAQSVAGGGGQAKLKVKDFISGGLLSALSITLMSNLHPLIYIWQGINKYWYPDATRFIPNTIHEFPMYTFAVADLHGHLNNLPNAIVLVAFIIVLWQNLLKQRTLITKDFKLLVLGFSVFLGVAYMTNAWDFVLYLGAAGFVWFLALWQKRGLLSGIVISGLITLALALWSLIFSLPFHLNFSSFAQGIGWVKDHSQLWRLMILWGFWGFISLTFLIALISKKRRKKIQPKTLLTLSLLAFGWILVITPEFIYLKDIYEGHYRANTMFKMAFAAWVIFGFAGSLTIQWLKNNLKEPLKTVWFLIILAVMAGCLTYPIWAIRSYYNGLKYYRGLNGTAYLKKNYPDDWAGIQWLNQNVADQPTILEAVGESYTDYARVSVHTGLPTVLGWRVHEWLWRGSFDPVGQRTEEVKSIYQLSDLNQAKQLINQYQIEYIFIGTLEHQAYPQLNETALSQLGKKVFEQNNVRIYQLF
ncbi:hypothetical protein KKD62_03665 [Patescibacteria group bacterium]|nr:hypothetical protein [Patescibacteria group bacterium]MBU1931104.1 hypothetical protein [Patescibacteria group bacterium]